MYSRDIVTKLSAYPTPFYFYDIDLLKQTAKKVLNEAKKYGFYVHYALKANSNVRILKILSQMGFGADCVSANEICRAAECGFNTKKIAYAGVGKTDEEINTALDLDIFTFNCESIPEIENINKLARQKGKIADIAIRITPNINAQTHQYITTGLDENKFGIARWQFDEVVETVKKLENINLISLHFHVGSQINHMHVFKQLCSKINEIETIFESYGFQFKHLNVGGGLGIDYENPIKNTIADFETYFSIFKNNLNSFGSKQIHFELGRSIVAQCGALITKVLYIKKGKTKNFAIVDGGMTDLIRPALYQAHHKIYNLTSNLAPKPYDIVGPICESGDFFAKNEFLNETQRGDLLCVASAGAYGEIMASQYNLRNLPKHYYSDEI